MWQKEKLSCRGWKECAKTSRFPHLTAKIPSILKFPKSNRSVPGRFRGPLLALSHSCCLCFLSHSRNPPAPETMVLLLTICWTHSRAFLCNTLSLVLTSICKSRYRSLEMWSNMPGFRATRVVQPGLNQGLSVPYSSNHYAKFLPIVVDPVMWPMP